MRKYTIVQNIFILTNIFIQSMAKTQAHKIARTRTHARTHAPPPTPTHTYTHARTQWIARTFKVFVIAKGPCRLGALNTHCYYIWDTCSSFFVVVCFVFCFFVLFFYSSFLLTMIMMMQTAYSLKSTYRFTYENEINKIPSLRTLLFLGPCHVISFRF